MKQNQTRVYIRYCWAKLLKTQYKTSDVHVACRYRLPSLFAGVMFSRYPAYNETVNNRGVVCRLFFRDFYDNLVQNPRIIEGKTADNKFSGT